MALLRPKRESELHYEYAVWMRLQGTSAFYMILDELFHFHS